MNISHKADIFCPFFSCYLEVLLEISQSFIAQTERSGANKNLTIKQLFPILDQFPL